MGAGPHGRSSRLQDCKVARPPLELDRFFFAALHESGPEQVLLQKSICRLIERMTDKIACGIDGSLGNLCSPTNPGSSCSRRHPKDFYNKIGTLVP